MVQKSAITINPAGQPRVTESGKKDSYTREQFMQDLNKVATKRASKK